MIVIFSFTTSIARPSPQFRSQALQKNEPLSPSLTPSPLEPPRRIFPAALVHPRQTSPSSPPHLQNTNLLYRVHPERTRFSDVHLPTSRSPTPSSSAPNTLHRRQHALHRICFVDPLDRHAEHFIDIPKCPSPTTQDLIPQRRHPPQP